MPVVDEMRDTANEVEDVRKVDEKGKQSWDVETGEEETKEELSPPPLSPQRQLLVQLPPAPPYARPRQLNSRTMKATAGGGFRGI